MKTVEIPTLGPVSRERMSEGIEKVKRRLPRAVSALQSAGYALRLAPEPMAAGLAAPRFRADPSALVRNVQATRKAKSIKDETRLDLDCHELILKASGNSRLLKLWRSLRGELELWLGQLHRNHQIKRLDTRDGTAGAHEAIIRCFRNATPQNCERLLRQHIQGWREWLPSFGTNLNE